MQQGRPPGTPSRSDWLVALAVCAAAATAYLLWYGPGAVVEPDSAGYEQFAPYRTLGYPAVLWIARSLGALPYLGSLQLLALIAATVFAWRLPYGRVGWLRWFVLLGVIGNPELVKHCFREMSDAPFATVVFWHVAVLVRAIRRGEITWRDVTLLVASGALAALLRPAALPIVGAEFLAVFIGASVRRAAALAFGLVVCAWLLPSAVNWTTRGYFATQQFGAVLVLNTVAPAVATLPDNGLSPNAARLRDALAPAGRLVARTPWPFERALAATLVSEYTLAKSFPELKRTTGPVVETARRRTSTARELALAATFQKPGLVLDVYSANLIALAGVPGLISPAEKAGMAKAIAASSEFLPLRDTASAVLDKMRVVPPFALGVARALGMALFGVAGLAAIIVIQRLVRRFLGAPPRVNGLAVPAVGAILVGYLALVAAVNAVPRFMIVVWPVVVLFAALAAESAQAWCAARQNGRET